MNRFEDVTTVQELVYGLVSHSAMCAEDSVKLQAVATAGIKRLGEILNDIENEDDLGADFSEFIRKPFVVSALEITRENIHELSDLIGEYGEDENGPYIDADREKVPTVYRVVPGYWVTKMGKNVRCYSARVFAEQFTPLTGTLDRLMRKVEEESNGR